MKALSHTYACTHSPLNSPLKKQYYVGSVLFSVSRRWQWAMVTQTCIQLGLFLPEELWFSWFPRSLIFSSVAYIKHIFSKRKLPQGEMSFPLIHTVYFTFSSVQFSRSVVLNALRPHGLQHARLPRPSPTPGSYSNSCPSSRWCHPTISSSVIPFSFRLPSFPASGSFLVSQFFI